MRWFRSNRRIGASFALAALAFQFVVAFAHVHGTRSAALGGLVATVAFTTGGVQTPPGHSHNKAPDTACDICATINLIASATNAAAPSVSLPVVFAAVQFESLADTQFAERRLFQFQSRAPPTA
jgi:hypothetical protein